MNFRWCRRCAPTPLPPRVSADFVVPQTGQSPRAPPEGRIRNRRQGVAPAHPPKAGFITADRAKPSRTPRRKDSVAPESRSPQDEVLISCCRRCGPGRAYAVAECCRLQVPLPPAAKLREAPMLPQVPLLLLPRGEWSPRFPSESKSMSHHLLALTIAMVAYAGYRAPPSWDGGVGIRLCSDDQRPSPRLSRHHTHPTLTC